MEEEKEGKGKKYFVVLIAFISLFLIAAVIAFVMYFTNNLSTDLTTFYVQYGAQEIRRDTGRMQFEKGVYYTFRCEYPLGFPSNERGDRYTVSVEATEAGKEIEYLVDGSNTRFYPKSPDVSQSFEIVRSKDSFTFCIPAETTFKSILTKAYEGKEIKNIPAVDLTAKDYLSLTVKSYDGGTVIRIGFGFDGEEGTEPDVTPLPPDITKYSINDDSLGSGSGTIKFECVDEAVVGEKVSFTVTIIDGDKYPMEITSIWLHDIECNFEDEWIGKGEGTFSFIMPAYHVTIMFYTWPKE